MSDSLVDDMQYVNNLADIVCEEVNNSLEELLRRRVDHKWTVDRPQQKENT